MLHEARRIPELRHAVRRATREWWKNIIESEGGEYPVIRTPKEIKIEHFGAPFEVSAFEVIVFPRGVNSRDWFFENRIVREGGKRGSINLAMPWQVYNLMAREIGLNCRICGEIEKADYLDRPFFCSACKINARGNIATKLLRLLEDEIQKVKRKRGETPAREPRRKRIAA